MGRAAPTRTSTLTAAPMALRDQPPRTSRPATSQAIGSRRIARKAHGTRTDTAIQGQAGRRTPQYKAEREGEGTQSSGGWEVTHWARAQGRSREGRRVSTRSPPLVTSPQVKSARLTFSRSSLARPLLCELALEGPSSQHVVVVVNTSTPAPAWAMAPTQLVPLARARARYILWSGILRA